MKNALLLFVATLVLASLLLFMFLFQVRYDEVAVRTTFERATDAGVMTQAGLYLRWPPPIQRVHKYSTLPEMLEQSEQITLGDGSSLVVRSYLVWRISDPLRFYTSVQDSKNAQAHLLPMLKTAVAAALGQRRLDELVSLGHTALDQVEADALKNVQARLLQQPLPLGVEVTAVGIRRLLLPEANTTDVFNAMKQTRQLMAARVQADGEFQAKTIENSAETSKQTILSFARLYAGDIVAQGVAEAAKYIAEFDKDPQLAQTLRQIDALKKALAQKTTIVLRADQIGASEITGGPAARPPSPVKAGSQPGTTPEGDLSTGHQP
jgi:membrane protease subunit HflC